MVLANLFAVTAIGLTFSRMIRCSLQEPCILLRLGRLGAVAAVLALAALEQVNFSQRTVLSRNFERQHLAAVAAHPRQCRSFYAAPEAGRAPSEVQIDAMMIAQAQYLPTINGYSGLLPLGWDFYDTNAAGYERHAVRWALRRGVGENLCRIDVESGKVDVRSPSLRLALRRQRLPNLVWSIARIRDQSCNGRQQRVVRRRSLVGTGTGTLGAMDRRYGGRLVVRCRHPARSRRGSVNSAAAIAGGAHAIRLARGEPMPDRRYRFRSGARLRAANHFEQPFQPLASMPTEKSCCASRPIGHEVRWKSESTSDNRQLGVGVERVVIREMNLVAH